MKTLQFKALGLALGFSALALIGQEADPGPYKAAQPTTPLPPRPLKTETQQYQAKLAQEERDARFLMDLQLANQVRAAQSSESVRQNQEKASAALLEYYTRMLEPQRGVPGQLVPQDPGSNPAAIVQAGMVVPGGSVMSNGGRPAAAPAPAPVAPSGGGAGSASSGLEEVGIDGPAIARRKGLGFIAKGTIVDIRLYTRVQSSIPGPVIGEVIHDIWDVNQQYIVIPRGSKCTGASASMSGDSEWGGKVVFNDFIDPGGREIPIAIPVITANRVGVTGLPGKVNYHWGRIIGGSAVLAVISAATGGGSTPAGANNNMTSADMAKQNFMSSLGQASGQLMQRFTNIKPDIEMEEGSIAKVIIMQHMLVKPSQKVY